MKHAFPDDEKGTLWVKLVSMNSVIVLSVGDDGVGLPENFDIGQSKSLGLQLINLLVEHAFHGKILVEHGNGTHYRIKIPNPNMSEK